MQSPYGIRNRCQNGSHLSVLWLINLWRINVVLLAVANRWEEKKKLKGKRRISSGLVLRRLLAFCCKCLLYSVSFKIPVCQRTSSLVKLKWFKLLMKLGLSFRSEAYKVF